MVFDIEDHLDFCTFISLHVQYVLITVSSVLLAYNIKRLIILVRHVRLSFMQICDHGVFRILSKSAYHIFFCINSLSITDVV